MMTPQTMRSSRERSLRRCSKKLGSVIESPAVSVNARRRRATTDHYRRHVDRHAPEDAAPAGEAQQPGTALEALFEEAGDRDRVTGRLRERAQARGHQLPIDPGPGGQADRDPRFDEPGQIDGTGQ